MTSPNRDRPDGRAMTADVFLEQRAALVEGLDPWLNLIDADLRDAETEISGRPLSAAMAVLNSGALEVRAGETLLNGEDFASKADQFWFRIIYDAVETWYAERYGETALKAGRNAPLTGVILIHGAPYRLEVPTVRRTLVEEGETSWIHFEEEVHEAERPLAWLQHPPPIDRLPPGVKETVERTARTVAGHLRFLSFRQMAPSEQDAEAHKLVPAAIAYLQAAANRMTTGVTAARGLIWFDLQMAAEAMLKAVIRTASGKQPFSHDLPRLLTAAASHGVDFDLRRLEGWPSFQDISHWRYGQAEPPGLADQFKAYLTVLDLARAAAAVLPVGMPAGFGVLVRYAPWKFRGGDLGDSGPLLVDRDEDKT